MKSVKFSPKKILAAFTSLALLSSVFTSSGAVAASAESPEPASAAASSQNLYIANEGRFVDTFSTSNAAFDVSIAKDVSPDGDAFSLSSSASSGAGIPYFDLYGIDLEAAKTMQAFSVWVKVPYGKNYRFVPNFNDELNRFNGALTAYNTYSGTTITASGSNGIELPGGFEGYVVLDLKNGAIRKDWNGNTYSWSEFITQNGLSSLASWTYCGDLYEHPVVLDTFAFAPDYDEYIASLVATYTSVSRYIIRDGISVGGWYNDARLKIQTKIEGVLKNRYVYQVDAINGTGWVSVPLAVESADLTASGFEVSSATAFSAYIKVPDNIDDMRVTLKDSKDNPWYDVKLGQGYYYLVDIKKETVKRLQTVDNQNGTVPLPAGFDGYVVYDLTTFSNVSTLLSYNLAGLQFATYYSENMVGMTWYYGDVAIWGCSAEDIVNRYAGDVKIADDGTALNYGGYLDNVPGYKAEIVNNVSPDGTCQSYQFFEQKGIILLNLKGFGSLPASLISSQKAAVMWIAFDGEKTITPFLRINGSENMAIKATLTTVNTKTGAVNTTDSPEAQISLDAGFRGYVMFNLEDAVVYNAWNSTEAQASFADYITENKNGFTDINLYFNNGLLNNSTLYIDNISYANDINGLVNRITSKLPSGDVNEDGTVDLIDLVRIKKYLSEQTSCINFFRTDITGDSIIDTADMASLRKNLLGVEEVAVSPVNNQVAMAMYHYTVGDWNAKLSSTYGNESEFVNYYRVGSMKEADAVKKANGMCWLYVSDPFSDATATEFEDGFEESFRKKVQNYKDAGLWDVVAGFETEEMTTRLTYEQFIKLTRFIREVCPEKRILACTSPYEIKGQTLNNAPLNAEALAYVTDIGFDMYHTNDEKTHRDLLAKMKSVARSDARIWFFPCTYQYVSNTNEQYMIDSLNLAYKLLKEQENPGGIYLYTWSTYGSSHGLEDLLDPNGSFNYSTLANRITEIGKEILANK